MNKLLGHPVLHAVFGTLVAGSSIFLSFRFSDSSWFTLLLLFCLLEAAVYGAKVGLVVSLLSVACATYVNINLRGADLGPEMIFVSIVWLLATYLVGRNRDLYWKTRQMSGDIKVWEEFYRGLLHAIPDAIIRTDLEGTVTFCTDHHLALIGANSPEEAIGLNAFSLIHPEEQERAAVNMGRALDGEAVRTDYRCRRHDGSFFDGELSAVVLHDRFGNPDGFLGVLRDVSTERQKDRRIRELLDEKTQLLTEVQHRTKNHMNTVSSFISLELQSQTNEDAREALQETRNRVDIMRSLYDQLYNSQETESAALRPFLQVVISKLQDGYRGLVSARLETEIEEMTVSSQRMLMIGIIVNELLTNVFKYAFVTPKPDAKVKVNVYRTDSGKLRIDVADNGAGFPPELVVGKGYGFGLTVVNDYAEQHQGTFTICNEHGGVATVILDIS